MNNFVVLFVIAAAFAVSGADEDPAGVAGTCFAKNPGANANLIQEFDKDPKTELDEETQCFINCMAEAMGMTENGKTNMEKLEELNAAAGAGEVTDEQKNCLENIEAEGCKFGVEVMICMKPTAAK